MCSQLWLLEMEMAFLKDVEKDWAEVLVECSCSRSEGVEKSILCGKSEGTSLCPIPRTQRCLCQGRSGQYMPTCNSCDSHKEDLDD